MKILKLIFGIIIVIVLGLYIAGKMYTYDDKVSIEVNAPVEKAFAIFNDPDMLKSWMCNDNLCFESIENISGDANEIGSQWKVTFKEPNRTFSVIETITTFKENELVAFDMDADNFSFHLETTFEDLGNKTRITEHQTGKSKNAFINAAFLFTKNMVHNSKLEMYTKLKDLIESN